MPKVLHSIRDLPIQTHRQAIVFHSSTTPRYLIFFFHFTLTFSLEQSPKLHRLTCTVYASCCSCSNFGEIFILVKNGNFRLTCVKWNFDMSYIGLLPGKVFVSMAHSRLKRLL